MSFEDSEKTSRVTLQQHYNFVMNQVVSITYDLWHIIFMKILLIEDNQRTQEWVTQGLSEAGYVIDAVSDGRDGLYLALKDDYALIILADLTNVKNSKANPCYLPYCKGFCR